MVFRHLGFLAVFFFITVNPAKAQNRFQEGYIVTNSNDTLYGKVMDRNMKAFGQGIYKKVPFKGKGL